MKNQEQLCIPGEEFWALYGPKSQQSGGSLREEVFFWATPATPSRGYLAICWGHKFNECVIKQSKLFTRIRDFMRFKSWIKLEISNLLIFDEKFKNTIIFQDFGHIWQKSR